MSLYKLMYVIYTCDLQFNFSDLYNFIKNFTFFFNKRKVYLLLFILLSSLMSVLPHLSAAQENLWHNKERSLRYTPEGENFVIKNGERKFNRALYGTNSGYRTETGDLPEFALYMPGMGGNLRFALINDYKSIWITQLETIKATYKPGSMVYEISDQDYLGNGKLFITVLSSADKDGLIIKTVFQNTPSKLNLMWTFGGATGKKFSRDGDIGADPESVFYLHTENCLDNVYSIKKEGFVLRYGSGKVAPTPEQKKTLVGVFPKGSYKIINANLEDKPLDYLKSTVKEAPVFTGQFTVVKNQEYFFSIYNPFTDTNHQKYNDLKRAFNAAEQARLNLVNRVKVNTPDPYINTLGGALAAAADGIWESPTFLHGAVAWRMRLNAWRGAYVADVLGWHDRAKLHFTSYSKSQVLSPEFAPVVSDTLLNLARQKEVMGTSMFSSGYISRHPNANTVAHHYNMNLVFFDQIYTYFKWTKDVDFLKELWPTLERNMKWEKRNFDADGDGLYDAYASIWASDALQYSGGGVTHTSSYNYRANVEMARLAKIIGKDATPYEKEAAHILHAIQNNLWLADKGWFAEYKDLLGNQLVHPQAGVWTIYHAIDSKVPDQFQAYQALKYVDREIPRIPIKAKGLKDNGYYTISTTNWHPYTWSVNNVALAELMHTSLAYWQGGRKEEAFKLWESSLIESMYLGASPGNFQQLSFYDAMRGELYRDFADPVAMVARTLVEGLFGIQPDALNNQLIINPGLPKTWDFASLEIQDIHFDYKRNQLKDTFTLTPKFPFKMDLMLQLKAHKSKIKSVKVNGVETKWTLIENSIDYPEILINCGKPDLAVIEIIWEDENIVDFEQDKSYHPSDKIVLANKTIDFISINDPQQVLKSKKLGNGKLEVDFNTVYGDKTIFLKVKQGDFIWFEPLNFKIHKELSLNYPINQKTNNLNFTISSGAQFYDALIVVNAGENEFKQTKNLTINENVEFNIPTQHLVLGSNRVQVFANKKLVLDTTVINWDITPTNLQKVESVDLSSHFNDKVTQIFKNKYLSPRPKVATLQLPTQGIGNWCYPLINPEINDEGLRKVATENKGFVVFKDKISFQTPITANKNNIVFTSQWDNFPTHKQISLSGKAKHAYLLMAGSTNPMQSRLVNAVIKIVYADGTREVLELKNPENWWPIEQDFFIDDYAFAINATKPPRLYLKTGEISRNFKSFTPIKGFTNYGVDGGAATILDLPLDYNKELKYLSLEALANDVVVGVMAITLVR
jgi:hypothetical protein